MDDHSPAHEWRSGIELLSLDFVRPVYSQLGVNVLCEETLRGLTRDTLLARIGEYFPNAVEKGRVDFYSNHVRPFRAVARKAFGEGEERRIEYWIRYIACSEWHNPWIVYQDSLMSWVSIFKRTGEDPINFSTDPAVIVRELDLAGDLDSPTRMLSEQRTRPLTDWDRGLFQKYGLLEISEGSDFFPFVDAVILAIGMNRFQKFWRWLSRCIDEVDLDHIASFVKKHAARKHFEACFIAPRDLPLPE